MSGVSIVLENESGFNIPLGEGHVGVEQLEPPGSSARTSTSGRSALVCRVGLA